MEMTQSSINRSESIVTLACKYFALKSFSMIQGEKNRPLSDIHFVKTWESKDYFLPQMDKKARKMFFCRSAKCYNNFNFLKEVKSRNEDILRASKCHSLHI